MEDYLQWQGIAFLKFELIMTVDLASKLWILKS